LDWSNEVLVLWRGRKRKKKKEKTRKKKVLIMLLMKSANYKFRRQQLTEELIWQLEETTCPEKPVSNFQTHISNVSSKFSKSARSLK
jgi:hypothetical protein